MAGGDTGRSGLPGRIEKLRKSKGLTQGELGKALPSGYSQGAVSSWETGDRTPPLETLVELADYFDVDLRWLYDEGSPKKREPRSDSQAALDALRRSLVELAEMDDDELLGRVRRGLEDEEPPDDGEP